MAEVNWTAEAERWLRCIHDHIAQDNPAAAAKVVWGIHERAQVLQRFPGIGHKYRDETLGEIRVLLYGHYRIAYIIRSQERVDVLGVFHGALDIDRYLP